VIDYENYSDTISLGYGECINVNSNLDSFCFDSIITDSRCPEDVTCIWAGEAIARFRINNHGKEPVYINLHTGTKDTIVTDYSLSFLDLFPYPNTKIQRNIKDFNARIVIKRK
jgi:hypothetical protein